ncbi:MAG: histidine ammonia-lyase [Candidatus Muiribacterium halophilum]|uniref:Histidine ammonia-lyase n=1 Tax=Muiribacterium halophilum TaxID=2053465 RepID=A0A2N5ZMC5_MUIH1|nr:MAG: histidine ammonia-lyase [Candidatus Muirbacterium halophilum]
MKNFIEIDGNSLNLRKIRKLIEKDQKIKLSKKAKKTVLDSYQIVKSIISKEKTVYGITTGFGSFAQVRISEKDTAKLQENLVFSHAAGVGEPFDPKTVKIIMLLRANALAKGLSGVSPETIELLIEFYNRNIIPYVPKYGSVGASGDLAPLSHIALCLIGHGQVFYKGKWVKTSTVLKKEKLKPLKLKAKEGLALTNGTQMMTAVAVLSILKFEDLLKKAIISAGMSLEALLGSLTPFRKEIHNARPHYGQKKIAEIFRKTLEDSDLIHSHLKCTKVQDAYTLRCIPQVYGACLDTLKSVSKVIEIEINSATDNPLIISEDVVLSAGNFHGEPIALNLDFLAIAVSEIANMAERRIDRLLNNASNQTLPPFLVKNGGLNSGLMIAQYTAAALVSENKILSHPASVDSIPTSANQEDHVSMGSIGATKIIKILENLDYVVNIELLCAFNALQFHKQAPSRINKKVVKLISEELEPWETDHIAYIEIETIKDISDTEDFKKIISGIKL